MAIYNNERDPNEVDSEKTDYTFYIDRKVTVWYRETHSVEASSQEEANSKMIEVFKDVSNDLSETFIEQEELYDTMEDLSPEDNQGEATAELFTEDMDSLADNAKKISKIF